ncbi:MAG: flagellar hook-length control protein FliK [Chloroflexi bacterium]|nr:flagellar hook-length control protein FliK [Chloroflexota bacterium]
MVQQALPRQDSIVALTSALAGVVGRIALPQEVVKAAQQVLGQAMTLDGGKLDGATIQNAVRNSGIFQEAMLANGQGKAAGDMKSSLLGLQRQLGAWLGGQAPVDQLSKVPPQLKGIIPRARLAPMAPPDLPDDPELVGKILLERTEAALSRMRLHQSASLPDPGAQRNEAQWSLDLPVNLAGQQTLLQMQIHRDPEGDATRPEDRGWQVRFAINLSEAGEVGAQISLRGKATGVLLWAEDAGTADLLSSGVEALRAELEAVGLMPGAVVVRAGAPSQPVQQTPRSGNLVDAVS